MEIRIDTRNIDIDALARSFVRTTVLDAIRYYDEPIESIYVALSRGETGVRCTIGSKLDSGEWLYEHARAADLSEAVRSASDLLEVALHAVTVRRSPEPYVSHAA